MKRPVSLVLASVLIICAFFLGRNSIPVKPIAIVPENSPAPNISTSSITPSKTISSSPPPVSVKLISTAGWLTAENKTFRIKYPAETFRPIVADNYIQLQWKNNSGNLMSYSPDFVMENYYTGGSRREWYLKNFNYYANEVVFTEKLLGKIDVLEAQPKGVGASFNILIANGNTLIDVLPQGVDQQLVETIASTIEFK